MFKKKLLIRDNFRNAVFVRDGFKCKVCNADEVKLDAHHILPRITMPYGGYVIENGISLCKLCHIKAEALSNYVNYAIQCDNYPGYLDIDLFELIGSSEEIARQASERLKDE